MPSLALGTAAGAGGPLADILDRMVREEATRQAQQRIDEEIRAHKADEVLHGRQIDEMGLSRMATLAATLQNQANLNTDREDRRIQSTIKMRTPGSIITPGEKASDRGQAPDSSYTFQPQNMGSSSAGPTADNPEAPPAGEVAGTPDRFKWNGTADQLHDIAMANKSGQDNAMVRDAAGNYVPRSTVRENFLKGVKTQGWTPPDRTVVATDQGFVPRPKVAAAAGSGTPMQQPDPAQVKNRRDMASAVGSHFEDANSLLAEAEAKGYLGPLAGRTYGEFLAGKVGSTGSKEGDDLLGELRMSLGMIGSGVASLHGRSGANYAIAKDIQDKMNSGKMSYELIHGGLKELKKWTDKYGSKSGAQAPAASDPYDEYLKSRQPK